MLPSLAIFSPSFELGFASIGRFRNLLFSRGKTFRCFDFQKKTTTNKQTNKNEPNPVDSDPVCSIVLVSVTVSFERRPETNCFLSLFFCTEKQKKEPKILCKIILKKTKC